MYDSAQSFSAAPDVGKADIGGIHDEIRHARAALCAFVPQQRDALGGRPDRSPRIPDGTISPCASGSTDAIAVVVAVAVAYLVRFDVTRPATVVSGEFSPSYLSVSVVARGRVARRSRPRTHARPPRARQRTGRVLPRLRRRPGGSSRRSPSSPTCCAWRSAAGYLGFAAPLGLGAAARSAARGGGAGCTRSASRAVTSPGILVIGHRDKAARLIGELHKNPRAGYAVLGVCVPTGEIVAGELIGGVPVLGSMDRAAEIAERDRRLRGRRHRRRRDHRRHRPPARLGPRGQGHRPRADALARRRRRTARPHAARQRAAADVRRRGAVHRRASTSPSRCSTG